MQLQIKLYECVCLRYYKHVGGPPRGVKIYGQYRMKGAPGAPHYIAVRGEHYLSEQRETWFGRVIAFVQYQTGATWRGAAFVHWFEEVPNTDVTAELHMSRLRLAKQQRPSAVNTMRTMDYTDLVTLEDIIEPVLIQPSGKPSGSGRVDTRYFFYNHFVR